METRSMTRARWAAIGAAIAVSTGAGGAGLLHATVPDDAAAFVPITPCRLVDTRSDTQVGGRSTPIGPAETFVVTATGAQGECSGSDEVPAGARGVALNVTAVGATEPTYLTLWPEGEQQPNASALNPAPGQPPTPNAVTTDLNAAGELAIFNRFGHVHVIADVVGYYTGHHHDDRYYTRSEADAAFGPQDITTTHHPSVSAGGHFPGTMITEQGATTAFAFSHPYENVEVMLNGPVAFGNATYRVKSVTWCASLSHSTVAFAIVSVRQFNASPANTSDTTERRGVGCWTVHVDDTSDGHPTLLLRPWTTGTGPAVVTLYPIQVVWTAA